MVRLQCQLVNLGWTISVIFGSQVSFARSLLQKRWITLYFIAVTN